jgi:hypothetical protein
VEKVSVGTVSGHNQRFQLNFMPTQSHGVPVSLPKFKIQRFFEKVSIFLSPGVFICGGFILPTNGAAINLT